MSRKHFIDACSSGDLNHVKNIHVTCSAVSNDEFPYSLWDGFQAALNSGRKDVAEWLMSIEKYPLLSRENNFALVHACVFGHEELAQWLWQVTNRPSASACVGLLGMSPSDDEKVVAMITKFEGLCASE